MSNITKVGNSITYTPSNYYKPSLTDVVSFTPEQVSYLNERGISNNLTYADLFSLGSDIMREICTHKTAPEYLSDSGKRFVETYAGYLNEDPYSPIVLHNWNADGTSTLSQEQLDYLDERYDLRNLTWEEYKRYLGDLTWFNAIPAKEFSRLTYDKEKEYVFALAVENGLLPGWDANTNKDRIHIPEDTFNLLDYLIAEYKKASVASNLLNAYGEYSGAPKSSYYGMLIRVCDQLGIGV